MHTNPTCIIQQRPIQLRHHSHSKIPCYLPTHQPQHTVQPPLRSTRCCDSSIPHEITHTTLCLLMRVKILKVAGYNMLYRPSVLLSHSRGSSYHSCSTSHSCALGQQSSDIYHCTTHTVIVLTSHLTHDYHIALAQPSLWVSHPDNNM